MAARPRWPGPRGRRRRDRWGPPPRRRRRRGPARPAGPRPPPPPWTPGQLPGAPHRRTEAMTSSAKRRRLSILTWSASVSGPGRVGPAESHDHVGDPLLLEPPDAVDGVGIGRDDVDLEGPGRGPLLLAQLAEAFAAGRAGPQDRRRRAATRRERAARRRAARAWPPIKMGSGVVRRRADLDRRQVVDGSRGTRNIPRPTGRARCPPPRPCAVPALPTGTPQSS